MATRGSSSTTTQSSGSEDGMKEALRQAFESTCRGYSPDRVVADPDLNCEFLAACRQLGIGDPDATVNHRLLNLRKQGELRGLNSNSTSFSNEDEYRFAAEMAARFIERRDGVTLDDLICDPDLAGEFDELASRLAPGYSSIEYRWAALNLRKSKQLEPEILSRVVGSQIVRNFRVANLDLSVIPRSSGLYLLYCGASVLYVGEAENLNSRLRKHLDHSDNKGFARWLWEEGADALFLEIHVLPDGIETRVRRALEIELIRSRNPMFNVKR
jgi:site-specific DNA-methyltransferase (adenine-specific)